MGIYHRQMEYLTGSTRGGECRDSHVHHQLNATWLKHPGDKRECHDPPPSHLAGYEKNSQQGDLEKTQMSDHNHRKRSGAYCDGVVPLITETLKGTGHNPARREEVSQKHEDQRRQQPAEPSHPGEHGMASSKGRGRHD